MALHDNPLWILSHIQHSFIVSDSTANSQLVLTASEHKPYLAELAQREGLDLQMEKGLNPIAESESIPALYSITQP